MLKKTNRIACRFLFALSISILFWNCGSDKRGDAIGSLKTTSFPENYELRKNEIFIASGLRGPEDRSEFPARIPVTVQKYSQGATNRLAILLTDTTASWMGVVHALKTIGIPFVVTTDYKRAINHKVVLVYPVISGAALSADALQALAAFPRNGGVLIGTQVLGALNEVFGFEEPVPSKQHFEIIIPADSTNPYTGEFQLPKEMTISLGNKERFKETIGTYSYSKTQLPPLATYEDKSAAITQKFYENGASFAFGFDIGFMFLKAHNNRHEDWNRSFANEFEPTLDVILRLLKNIYLKHDRNAAYISTVPYDKSLAVCITHNINSANSLDQALAFAKEEIKMGVYSTYFIQTKYIKDRKPFVINSKADFEIIKSLHDLGMDVQSNSVSGSPLFDQFEQGSGTEVYPDYKPYVMALAKTYKGTIYGEMRVSRFLLDAHLPDYRTLAFRTPQYYTPFTYPQSLLASGYRFSSSVSANSCLTHFPVQLNYNREYDSELDAFEFPLTDDDELPPYSIKRAESAINLARKIARYQGCFIGQVHPNPLGLIVEQEFVKALKGEAWFGKIRDFGLWWAARNEVTMDIINESGKRVVFLNVPKRMEGLAVMLPLRSTPTAVEGGGKYSVDGKLIIFELAEGKIKITLDN